MESNEFKKELLKLTLEEVIKIYEEERTKRKLATATRYTLGKLDVLVTFSATNQYRHITEYSITVPEGILCYVKTNTADTVEKMIREINEIITKYQL